MDELFLIREADARAACLASLPHRRVDPGPLPQRHGRAVVIAIPILAHPPDTV